MAKKTKKHADDVLLLTDEVLSSKSGRELSALSNELERARARAESRGGNTTHLEVELAYLQREFAWREKRNERHLAWLNENEGGKGGQER